MVSIVEVGMVDSLDRFSLVVCMVACSSFLRASLRLNSSLAISLETQCGMSGIAYAIANLMAIIICYKWNESGLSVKGSYNTYCIPSHITMVHSSLSLPLKITSRWPSSSDKIQINK